MASAEDKPIVIVSVAPYKWVVEKIAGDAVEVFLIVPAGTSAHTFEPTPRDMMRACHAKLWFTLGEAFEKKAIAAIAANNSSFKTVDLTTGVDLIQSDPLNSCACHHHSSSDLHLWLSPKELKVQAKTIADALNQLVAGSTFTYEPLALELDQLDHSVKELVSNKNATTVLVSHPAFGYFCRDYGFKQLSIEVEGKDPTPRRMHDLVNVAKEAQLTKVFTEPQYSDKGAQLIAKEIGAKIVVIDPYNENVADNLKLIAKEFAQ